MTITLQRQKEGIAIAKAKGKQFGRPKTEYPKDFCKVYQDWKKNDIQAVDAMRLLNLKKSTFYKLVKELEKTV